MSISEREKKKRKRKEILYDPFSKSSFLSWKSFCRGFVNALTTFLDTG